MRTLLNSGIPTGLLEGTALSVPSPSIPTGLHPGMESRLQAAQY